MYLLGLVLWFIREYCALNIDICFINIVQVQMSSLSRYDDQPKILILKAILHIDSIIIA